MTYTYRCSEGHEIESPHEIERCPVKVHGRACKGTLRRVGAGSRKGGKR